MQSRLVDVFRRAGTYPDFSEIKDPSIVSLPDKTYLMFASIGSSVTQKWRIGRFTAQNPAGPWQEADPVELNGVNGPEVCAPAVQAYPAGNGKLNFNMYVQTACFERDGVIALAKSEDGHHFEGQPDWTLRKEDLDATDLPIEGLYDAGISDLNFSGKAYECMTFSAYRKVGCGDVYMALREQGAPETEWSKPALVLRQEDVPFHNHPNSPNFEWGLEGAKIIELSDNNYLMIGVCFLEKEHEHLGTRQRVFFATAKSPYGPFDPVSTPLDPTVYDIGQGENGHPDTIDLGDKLGILYQERAGNHRPWHLRYAEITKADLLDMVSPPKLPLRLSLPPLELIAA